MNKELKSALVVLWILLEEDGNHTGFLKDGYGYDFIKHPHYVEIVTPDYDPRNGARLDGHTVGRIQTMRYLKEGPTFKTAKRNFIYWWKHHKEQ